MGRKKEPKKEEKTIIKSISDIRASSTDGESTIPDLLGVEDDEFDKAGAESLLAMKKIYRDSKTPLARAMNILSEVFKLPDDVLTRDLIMHAVFFVKMTEAGYAEMYQNGFKAGLKKGSDGKAGMIAVKMPYSPFETPEVEDVDSDDPEACMEWLRESRPGKPTRDDDDRLSYIR